jgi:hypothetical protein
MSFWVWLLKPVYLLLYRKQMAGFTVIYRPANLVASGSGSSEDFVPLDNIGSQSFQS